MRRRCWAIVGVVVLLGAHPAAATPSKVADAAWLEGYTMIRLEPGADWQRARLRVEAEGGQVAVIVPQAAMFGWVPADADARLRGRDGIRSLHRRGEHLPADAPDPRTRLALRFFDRAANRAPAALQAPKTPSMMPPGSDAFDPGPISRTAILRNLETAVPGLLKAGDVAALTAGTDVMLGTVSVSLFYVESNGQGADPDTFDWDAAAEQEVFDEAVLGLSWWSDQASAFSDCWVTFIVQPYLATEDARCAQWREPVLHPSSDYAGAVADVMAAFGYSQGNHLARVAAYNIAQRQALGTDAAFSAFVAANPTGARTFTDGQAAWTYLGGPYTALLQHSFDWSFRRVFAHETAHIFGACDEYSIPGYGGCSDCDACWTTGVENGNCEACNPNAVPCMMRANSWTLCAYTPGQIGWWRSPCSAGVLPAPQLTSLAPATVRHGETTTVVLQGSYFNPGTTVDFGSGIEVLSLSRIDAQELHARVHADLEAVPGTRDVTLRSADGTSSLWPARLAVAATPVHYVAGWGTARFPYTSPQTAAPTLAAVLMAASSGDTVRIVEGTYAAIEVRKSLVLEGGWSNDFVSRHPVELPTVITPSSNRPAVQVRGPGIRVVLEGLVLRGGSGDPVATPTLGSVQAGGGLLVFDAEVVMRDSRIEGNRAGTSGSPGAGGGAFLWRSRGTFEDCAWTGNRAGRGGALCALESRVTLRRNRFEANAVDPQPGWGGAVAWIQSHAEVEADTLQGNTGAVQGGAMHVVDCDTVSLRGVVVLDHTSTGDGAGIWAASSGVWLAGCEIRGQVSGGRGGGLAAQGGTLQLTSTLLAGNQAAVLGGALATAATQVVVRHATVVGNQAPPGSGLYLDANPPGCEVHDSIFADNAAGGAFAGTGDTVLFDGNTYWNNDGLDHVGVTPGPGVRYEDPRFAGATLDDYHLGEASPCIDAVASERDADGSPADRGAYGGPDAGWPPPPRVEGVAATQTPGGVRLQWSASTAPTVAYYVVYRDTDAAFVPAPQRIVARVTAPTVAWIDSSAPPGAAYRLAAVDGDGRQGGYSAVTSVAAPTDVTPSRRGVATLQPPYPNPTNPGAWIDFDLPRAAHARLEIYDVRGRRVRVLRDASSTAGPQHVYWNGRDTAGRPVASGVYWVRLQVAPHTWVRRLVVSR